MLDKALLNIEGPEERLRYNKFRFSLVNVCFELSVSALILGVPKIKNIWSGRTMRMYVKSIQHDF